MNFTHTIIRMCLIVLLLKLDYSQYNIFHDITVTVIILTITAIALYRYYCIILIIELQYNQSIRSLIKFLEY